jgi:hypothetical protein
MSFIKNLAKEFQTVKSMIDIPDLKNERYKINKKIEESNTSLSKVRCILENETRIRQVIRDLEDLSEICFEGQPDKKDSAQQVIQQLETRVEESEKLSSSLEGELSRLDRELQRINEKLSAARANVRLGGR